MWTEKYRPKKFDEVVGHKEVVERIRAMLPDIPHLLFYGPAGVGKTTLAKVIINELKAPYIEINSSDERGIDVIRNRVKDFAKTTSVNAKIKIVLLDEADGLTADSQDALRRIMEKYSNITRFILTCNNIAKIIPPLKSRCKGGMFEFKPIEKEAVKKRVMEILGKEGVTITDEAFDAIYKKSQGDLRILDYLYQLSRITSNITIEDVSLPENTNYLHILKYIKARKYLTACKLITKEDVLPLFHACMKLKIPGKVKAEIVKIFAEYDFRSQFAITEEIQLYWLVGELIERIGGIE